MLEELRDFERIQKECDLSLEEVFQKIEVVSELEQVSPLEEREWRQKLRSMVERRGQEHKILS